MTYENIQIEQGNLTIVPAGFPQTRLGSAFYTVDHVNSELIKKDSSGNVVFKFFLATPVEEVLSLHFDGYYFWTLEKQGSTGFRVRKWEIEATDLVVIVDEHAFSSGIINRYDVNAMAVEFYNDTLDDPVVIGQDIFDVVDGEKIRIGDEIIIGPSTVPDFEGLYFHTNVINKVGDYTITVSPPLDTPFYANNEVYFTRSFFVFSDTAPAGLSGALYKFRYDDGFMLSLSGNNMFNGVRAAVFFSGKLLFVRAGEIIWLNPDSLNIYRSQAIDNLDATRGVHRTCHDLAGFSNTLYRLEQEHVYYEEGGFGGPWKTEDWSPVYNYNESSILSEVYFIAVKAEPPLLHKYVGGIPAEDVESEITVTVLDQFRSPVPYRQVDLTRSAGAGSLSVHPTNQTDLNGQMKVTYTASSTVGEITITAEVT